MGLLFNQNDKLENLFSNIRNEIKQEIDRSNQDYILNVNSKNFCEHLKSKYEIGSITLCYNEIFQLEPSTTTKRIKHPIFNKEVEVPAAHYTIVIPIIGDGKLLYKKPNLIIMVKTPEGYVENNSLYLNFHIAENESLDRESKSAIEIVKKYADSLTNDISKFNNSLEQYILNKIKLRRDHLSSVLQKAQSINIPIKRRNDIPRTFNVSIPQKKIIKQIEKPEKYKKNIKPTPTINIETYEEILEVCFDMSIVMERNPSTFHKFDEEEIRDNFIMHLNMYFKGEASGETFNKKGKTDILIRHEDQNIFICECKFWKGPQVLNETIDQILRYTTWRDTKSAIFIFNKTTQISSVLKKIDPTSKKHENYIKPYTCKNKNLKKEGIFGYIFNLPEDKEAEIYLTVMVFNVPEFN